MSIVVFSLIVAALVGVRFLRPGLLGWSVAWLVAIYLALRFGFTVPIPASVIAIYMGITAAALLAYVTSSRERIRSVTGPLVALATERRYQAPLAAVVLLIPALAGLNAYMKSRVPLQAPFFGRTIHPAPPASITVHGREVDLIRSTNPLRALERSAPQQFARHLANGRRTYYQNCVFCHGDNLAASGMYAHGLNPIPTNFIESSPLPQLTESFLFWRISKGGPGMPEEGGPWDSAMPAWEKFLSEEEIWEVILFLYDFTGDRPRALEERHE